MMRGLIAVILIGVAAVAPLHANDAIHPGTIWKDTQGKIINAHGAGLLSDAGHTYWYGEIKGEGAQGNTAQVGVSVYRSDDLIHWTSFGVALAASGDPASPIARGAIIERPKVLRRADGRYVMWFHLERAGRGYKDATVGTAIADRPQGPFRFVGALQPNGQQSRDMTLFQDDDGAAYLFYSSENNDVMHIARLTDDYLGVRDDFQRAFVGACYEAPAVFRSGAHYYFLGSTCTGWKPNAAHGAVADRPEGP
jgi:beta-xylosidase